MAGKDKYPNFFVGSVTQTSNDAFKLAEIAFPSLFMQMNMLLEITKVMFQLPRMILIDSSNTELFVQLSTKVSRTAVGNIDDEDIIAALTRRTSQVDTGSPANANYIVTDDIVSIDLTDSEGKGVLVAPQDLALMIDSTNTATTNTARTRVYFRLVKASSAEILDLMKQQLED